MLTFDEPLTISFTESCTNDKLPIICNTLVIPNSLDALQLLRILRGHTIT